MIKTRSSEFQAVIQDRRIAYTQVFGRENDIAAAAVLKDLAKFCRAHESTFHRDARMHAVFEGRREVWLRIQEYLNLSQKQIYNMHKVMELKEAEDGRQT